MPKFLLMPEGCTWQEIDRPQQKLETIYGLESSFYSPGHRIAIRNQETGETRIFSGSWMQPATFCGYMRFNKYRRLENMDDAFMYEGMEIANALRTINGNDILLLRDPKTELHHIYLNGEKFATFEDGKNAVIIADMMQLHIDNYSHMF